MQGSAPDASPGPPPEETSAGVVDNASGALNHEAEQAEPAERAAGAAGPPAAEPGHDAADEAAEAAAEDRTVAGAGGDPSSVSEPTDGAQPQERMATLSTNSAIAAKVTPIFEKLVQGSSNGLLPIEKVADLLAEMELSQDTRLKEDVAQTGKKEFSLEEIIDILSAVPAPSTSPSKSSVAKAPLKRVLTKNRDYMESGKLALDETVITYITKLDDHRRRCESEGRYGEAMAASERLADLKTAQVERIRSELIAAQARELEDVNVVYEDEMVKFNSMWEIRLRDFDISFTQSVEEMRVAHDATRVEYAEQLSAKRPNKPKPSRDYLNQKKIEASLVKVKSYQQATAIQNATAEMYQAELEQAQMAYDVEVRLKMVKQQAKQQQEMEALIRRGEKGRDELLLRRVNETEKRNFRFRNIVQELKNLHTLEIVHLENFLDGQVRAGKAVPLKNGFRRKREALLSSCF